MKIKISLIALVLVVFASCNPVKETKKEDSNTITEKYWKLTTLEGQKITMAANQEREVYFTLNTAEKRIVGFSGCNSFSGEYILEDGNRISFKNIAVTMKICPDVDFKESDFLEVLNLTDNYTLTNDVLSLNVGRRAPLAVFEAVYMK